MASHYVKANYKSFLDRCEIVSRVLYSIKPWQSEIDDLFIGLSQYCEFYLTQGCSTHVHIARRDGFVGRDMHGLLKSIIYYDRPVTAIMPPLIKETIWAKSNIEHLSQWSRFCPQGPCDQWAAVFNRIDDIPMK